MGWASSHKTKGHQFDSPSGHVPGLTVWSPYERQLIDVSLSHHCFSPSLSLSLPLSLKNKQNLSKRFFKAKRGTSPPDGTRLFHVDETAVMARRSPGRHLWITAQDSVFTMMVNHQANITLILHLLLDKAKKLEREHDLACSLGVLHNIVYRWDIIELYTLSLHKIIKQCHPNKFN